MDTNHHHHAKLDSSPTSHADYYAHSRPTTTTSPDVATLRSPTLLPVHGQRIVSPLDQRFVAGASFFHYNAYGSLRPGHEPIQLLRRQHIGLALHFIVSGFTFYFFSYGYGRLLADYLKVNSEQEVCAAFYVLVWPSALSIVFGVVSDSFPIWGSRRKSYMLLGWFLSLVMYAVLFILDAYSDSKNGSPFAVAYLVVSLLAACGIQISWLASVAASVEYAQREPIHYRGCLQATLAAMYYVGGVLARFLTAIVIDEGITSDDHMVSSLSIGGAAVVLGAVTLIALPFVVCFYHEEPSTSPPQAEVVIALRDRLQTFWRFCHQNVVYHVLFFTSLHLFLLGLFNQNVRDAVQTWSGVDNNQSMTVEVMRLVVDVASVLVWKRFLRNVGWRTLVGVGTLLYIAAYTVLTAFTTFNVVRSHVFYIVLLLIAEVPRAWLLLFTFALATEITDTGHEGATVAIAMSYQTLAGLADYTLAAISPDLLGYSVTSAEMAQDSVSTRAKVIKAFVVMSVINLLCLPVIRLLPQQKLDAQQKRAFGGYNTYAKHALLAIFAVLLCFNLAVNLMVVL